MITLAEQLAEARRELALRRNRYPEWVRRGTLSHQDAYQRLAAQAAIVETLQRLQEQQSGQLGLFAAAERRN